MAQNNVEELERQLAEERRLRLQAQQENERLCQKLDRYEERMIKYEERLDTMMSLLKEKSHRPEA